MNSELWLRPLQRYAEFDGRSGRAEFWQFFLAYNLAALVAVLTLFIADKLAFLLLAIVALGGLVPSIAVTVRRLHDIDKSGWFYFVSLIPLVGIIILLVWMCTPGTLGPNRFGDPDDLQWPADPTATGLLTAHLSRRSSSSGADDPLEKIEEMARLRENGILSDAEFAEMKEKLLGSSATEGGVVPSFNEMAPNATGISASNRDQVFPQSPPEEPSEPESYDTVNHYGYQFASEARRSRLPLVLGVLLVVVGVAGAGLYYWKPWRSDVFDATPSASAVSDTDSVENAVVQEAPPVLSLAGLTFTEFLAAIRRYPDLSSSFDPLESLGEFEGQQVIQQMNIGPQSRGKVVSVDNRTLLAFEACRAGDCLNEHAVAVIEPSTRQMYVASWRNGADSVIVRNAELELIVNPRCSRAGSCDWEERPVEAVFDDTHERNVDEQNEESASAPYGTEPPSLEVTAASTPARARTPLASLVSADDYPESALANGEQGRVMFQLLISPFGRATECRILQSSGSMVLDNQTCRIMRQRAAFIPARDATGRPTTGTITSSVTWQF